MPIKARGKKFINNNALALLTVVGVLGGTLLGTLIKKFSSTQWTPRDIMYLQFPGDLFLRMLKCLIIPLLVSSIATAIGGLDLRMSRRIAARAIIYYCTTTVAAVILGIILVTSIRPGTYSHKTKKNLIAPTAPSLTTDTLLDLIRNCFPENIIQSTMQQYRTYIVPNETLPREEWEIKSEYTQNTNVLGIVMFSVVLGITLGKLQDVAKPLQDFLLALSEAMMAMTSWVIWLSPLGVFFLTSAKVVEIESIGALVTSLGYYFGTVLLGLLIHGFGTIPLIFFICVRESAYKYIVRLGQVLATAFGTASSSATMPLTIKCLDNMNVDPRVTRFVIPIGATINMDGTALYEAVAAIFIAQLHGMSLTLGNIIAISITATAASIGAAGIPQAGLVTMVMVLDTVNIPSENIQYILAVDWLLDRFRTTINVMCDAVGAVMVNKLSRNDLSAPIDHNNAEPHELEELKSENREKV